MPHTDLIFTCLAVTAGAVIGLMAAAAHYQQRHAVDSTETYSSTIQTSLTIKQQTINDQHDYITDLETRLSWAADSLRWCAATVEAQRPCWETCVGKAVDSTPWVDRGLMDARRIAESEYKRGRTAYGYGYLVSERHK